MSQVFGGPTTTTKYNQQQNSQQQQTQTGQQTGQSTATTTPNLPGWYNTFLQSIPGLYSNLTGSLQTLGQKPLYGPQQQVSYQQNLNQMYGQAGQDLQSQLASRGMLNSGAGNQIQTQLQLGKGQQIGNYLAQVPQLNFQAQQSALGQLGNVIGNMGNFKIPYGQTIDQSSIQNLLNQMMGSSSTDTSGQQTQQTSGGLMNSLLGGLLNAGLSAFTGGLSGLFGGGGGGQNQSASPAPLLPTSPYSAQQAPPSYTPSYMQNPTASTNQLLNQLLGGGGF